MLSLQELNDERDIKLVYCNYCDIIDDKDFDRLTEVFTEDFTSATIDPSRMNSAKTA